MKNNFPLLIMLIFYGLIFGGVTVGLLWFFVAVIIELSKHCWAAVPIGTVALIIAAIELMAVQKPLE